MLKFLVLLLLGSVHLIALSKSVVIEPTIKQVKDQVTEPQSLKQLTNQYQFVDIGNASFSILFWDLYQSKLSTTTGKYPIEATNEKLLYEIHYLANISSDDLIKRTVEQWQHLGVAKAQYQPYLTTLKRIWPDIKKGDKLSLLIAEQKSLFYFNDNYIGDIDSPEFGPLFLDIWLSKNTSEPSLRRDLLGQYHDK